MSETAIFFAGLLVTALCMFFVAFTYFEVRRSYAAARAEDDSSATSGPPTAPPQR